MNPDSATTPCRAQQAEHTTHTEGKVGVVVGGWRVRGCRRKVGEWRVWVGGLAFGKIGG